MHDTSVRESIRQPRQMAKASGPNQRTKSRSGKRTSRRNVKAIESRPTHEVCTAFSMNSPVLVAASSAMKIRSVTEQSQSSSMRTMWSIASPLLIARRPLQRHAERAFRTLGRCLEGLILMAHFITTSSMSSQSHASQMDLDPQKSFTGRGNNPSRSVLVCTTGQVLSSWTSSAPHRTLSEPGSGKGHCQWL